MEFWRGEAYSKFFDHLESKGGFYYEVRTHSPCHLPYRHNNPAFLPYVI